MTTKDTYYVEEPLPLIGELYKPSKAASTNANANGSSNSSVDSIEAQATAQTTVQPAAQSTVQNGIFKTADSVANPHNLMVRPSWGIPRKVYRIDNNNSFSTTSSSPPT